MSRFIYMAVAALLLATPVAAQQEPTFQDRPLRAWVAELKAQAPQTRSAAAYAISSMGPSGKAAVPALIEALGDEEATVRFPVCVALREIGPAAAAAVPKLQDVRENDRSDDVAFMAKKALRTIQGETARAASP
jgi:HEAT repeat protein